MKNAYIQPIGMDLSPPLTLTLDGNDSPLHCHRLLSLFRRKRLTAFATWGNQEVVAKLFFHERNANTHFNREIKGYEALQPVGIPTPTLLFAGKVKDNDHDIFAILFERLYPIMDLKQVFTDKTAQDTDFLLQSMGQLLAKMHTHGLCHQDLHMGNFLITKDGLYIIDTATVSVHSTQPLSKQHCIKNLSLLLGSIPSYHDDYCQTIYQTYLDTRKWQNDKDRLKRINQYKNHYRLANEKQQLKRLFRNTDTFICGKDFHYFFICYKNEYKDDMIPFLYNPDKHLMQEGLIKSDNHYTDVKVTLNDQTFLITRSHVKIPWLRLKRFQSSPVAKKWYNMHRLLLYEPSLPKPIAMVEKRDGICNSFLYFITEAKETMANEIKQDDITRLYHSDAFPIFPLTFTFEAHPPPVQCHTVLRFLPQNRLTAFATWGTREIVIKLFFHPRKARFHFNRERKGHKHLQEKNIPTPEIVHAGKIKDDQYTIFAIIFERIYPISNIKEALTSKNLLLCQSIGQLLADMHMKGIYHQDLHTNNFILAQKGLYILDTATIRRTLLHKPLSKRQSLKNLGLLLASLPTDHSNYSNTIYLIYLDARKWLDTASIQKMVDQYQRRYRSKYEKRKLRHL